MSMSTRVRARSLPFSFTDDEFHRMSAAHGEVASVSKMEAGSPARTRGLGELALAALVELEPAVAEPLSAPAEWSVWKNGTLPGVMAGKRPVASPIWSCGTMSGIMAGKRPARNCPV